MTFDRDNEREFLLRAIELAGHSGRAGNRPFGAVVTAADGDMLAEGENAVASTGDITAHAELDALRRAIDAGHGERLRGATVYASGEPCPMCSAACVWAGIARIVFAASAAAFAEILPDGPRFGLSCADVVADANVGIEVEGRVYESEALAVMRDFGSDGVADS
ncbi:nucleoside deaminase [Gordonia sp. CPCC 206044]|uniref:nucleoside deaminase n=1 Tax=Gordonia sp. CPCC 206044 TaxID=3140793 RepID=UPI003AF3746D